MARPSGDKIRCSGMWTEAKFKAFIKNNLRQASRKWKPLQDCKKAANVSRGVYECAACKQHVTNTVVKVDKGRRKRVQNIFVDHINPIIDPKTGFTTWDSCIDNMFCELDNLQLLCGPCHDEKSMEERRITAEYRRKRKEENEV